MIDIDDNVPLPNPAQSDTWVTGVGAIKAGKLVSFDPVKPAKVDNVVEYKALATLPPDVHNCFLVGGPLNGQKGPIKGNAKTVELEIYNADGSVASVELYALNDMHPTPTFRIHTGSKTP